MTPKSYLSFIDSYKVIYGEKIAHVGTLAERMKTGATGNTREQMPEKSKHAFFRFFS